MKQKAKKATNEANTVAPSVSAPPKNIGTSTNTFFSHCFGLISRRISFMVGFQFFCKFKAFPANFQTIMIISCR